MNRILRIKDDEIAVIRMEGLRGAYVGSEIVCKACLRDEDWKEIEEKRTIRKLDILENPDEIFVCNRCSKAILYAGAKTSDLKHKKPRKPNTKARKLALGRINISRKFIAGLRTNRSAF